MADAWMDDVNAEIERMTFDVARDEGRGRRLPRAESWSGFSRVLIATDGSKESEIATEWTRALAARYSSHVTVVHALPRRKVVEAYHAPLGPAAAPEAVKAIELAGREALSRAASAIAAKIAQVDSVLEHGDPARVILRVARKTNANLVVLGSRGSGGSERFLLGGVADGVKSRARASVLLARNPPWPHRVLAPVDGSRASLRAAAVALDVARGANATATMLHVVPEMGPRVSAGGREGFEAALEAVGVPEGREGVEYAIRSGSPASRILAFAREGGFDLVVLGSGGLGGVRGIPLGSVANRVASHAEASALIVR